MQHCLLRDPVGQVSLEWLCKKLMLEAPQKYDILW